LSGRHKQRGAIDNRNATDFRSLTTDLRVVYKYEKEKRDGDLNILYSELLTRELPAIRNLYMLECF